MNPGPPSCFMPDMKRLLLVVLVLVAGCGKRPYTTQREALTAQIAKIKSAAAKAKTLTPALTAFGNGDGNGTPVKLATPLKLGGSLFVSDTDSKAPLANALFLPAETVKDIGVKEPDVHIWLDEEQGVSCLGDAALVLEKDECRKFGCDSDRAARCAEYLLGLHYVLVMTTDVNTEIPGMVNPTERFAGRAVLVELGSLEAWPVMAFDGETYYSSGILARDFKSPLPVALAALGARVMKQFPGATVFKKWTEKPAP